MIFPSLWFCPFITAVFRYRPTTWPAQTSFSASPIFWTFTFYTHLEIKFETSPHWRQIWGHFEYSTIKKDLLQYSKVIKMLGKVLFLAQSVLRKLWVDVSCDGAFRKTSSKMDVWTWPRRDAELPGTVCKVQRLKELQQRRLKLPSKGGMWVHLCATLCRRPLVSSPSLQGSCIMSNTITIKSFGTCNKIKQIPFS